MNKALILLFATMAIVVLIHIAHADPIPQPDAMPDPDPAPFADPDADPWRHRGGYYGGRGGWGGGYYGGRGGWGYGRGGWGGGGYGYGRGWGGRW